jgi:hypothetical protein
MGKRMLLKILKSSFLGFILFLSAQLQSQEKDNGTPSTLQSENPIEDTVKALTTESEWLPATSVYVELGGKGWLSLNVDFRRKETYAISIAAAILEEGISPNVMGYYFGGKRHRLEAGGGMSGIIADGGFNSMMLHGVIGYRNQKKKGLLFRAGFTPMFLIPFTDDGKYAFIPWAGISLGYSF